MPHLVTFVSASVVVEFNLSAFSMLLTPTTFSVVLTNVSYSNPKLDEQLWKQIFVKRVAKYRISVSSSSYHSG